MTSFNAFPDLRGIFAEGVEHPTTFSKLGPSESYPREERIKAAVEVFILSREAPQTEGFTPEHQEILDIEVDSFMRWVNLSDDELREAMELADQPQVDEAKVNELKEGE